MFTQIKLSRLWLHFSCLALLPIGFGCGGGPKADYGQLSLIPVDGRITLNGEPLQDAVVTFEDVENGTFSYGLTDSSGRYRLHLDSQTLGVTSGNKVVRVSTARRLPGLTDDAEEEDPDAASAGERVPDRYHKNSELTVEVSPSQKSFDFDLQGS